LKKKILPSLKQWSLLVLNMIFIKVFTVCTVKFQQIQVFPHIRYHFGMIYLFDTTARIVLQYTFKIATQQNMFKSCGSDFFLVRYVPPRHGYRCAVQMSIAPNCIYQPYLYDCNELTKTNIKMLMILISSWSRLCFWSNGFQTARISMVRGVHWG
jgi:hypothetical protein